MENIEDTLRQMLAIDNDAIAEFHEINPICFDKNKPDWLFPKLRQFFEDRERNEKIDEMLVKLEKGLNEQAKSHLLWEITTINKSLCIDDSYVEEFILEMQQNESENCRFQNIKSPYKTKSISMAIKDVPSNVIYDLTCRYGKYDHPYILAELANCYILAGEFIPAFPLLYRSAKQLVTYPNKYWNSEYGLVGAANTFRHLVIMAKR